MGEFKVLIVDDELERARSIGDMVKCAQMADSFQVEACVGLAQLRELLAKSYQPQIVFMGLSLAGEGQVGEFHDGVDVARSLQSQHPGAQLIYVASGAEHPSRMYLTEHVYCLHEPVSAEELEEALAKSTENIRARSMRPFGVKAGGRIVRITPADIVYIESDRRKVRIFMEDEVVEAYESLSGIASVLPETFIQCHKSFLVNMEKVVEMRGNSLDLVTGDTIPISQKRSRFARETFLEYLRNRP